MPQRSHERSLPPIAVPAPAPAPSPHHPDAPARNPRLTCRGARARKPPGRLIPCSPSHRSPQAYNTPSPSPTAAGRPPAPSRRHHYREGDVLYAAHRVAVVPGVDGAREHLVQMHRGPPPALPGPAAPRPPPPPPPSGRDPDGSARPPPGPRRCARPPRARSRGAGRAGGGGRARAGSAWIR